MSSIPPLAIQIELHHPGGIRDCFLNGIHPNDTYNGEPWIYELTSEYTRSPNFKHCVQVFVDHGLTFNDPLLLSVLLDDANTLAQLLQANPGAALSRYTLRCAYTPISEASLLHICAEFNHIHCAAVLLKYGVPVDIPAGTDEYGFGGQSPIFHTVNQNGNQSAGMLRLLLDHRANLQHTVRGLVWGKGYEWETFIPAVNPLSYCMMGLLPQMHREESIIAGNVSLLLAQAYEINYTPANVPCKYLLK